MSRAFRLICLLLLFVLETRTSQTNETCGTVETQVSEQYNTATLHFKGYCHSHLNKLLKLDITTETQILVTS